jgi:hypothetical protein
MIIFASWVAFILLSIIAIPVASLLDRRRLQADLLAAEAERSQDESASEAFAEAEATSSDFLIDPDGVESRVADILDGLGGDDMVAQFPDLDLAYLAAAYPGGPAEHGSANLTLLKAGVQSSVRKSWLLGRLSSYWLVKGDADKAFQAGVQSLLSASDTGAEEVAVTINFLQPVFAGAKQKDLATKLETMQSVSDGPVDAKQIKKLVKKMGNRKSKAAVLEAAELLFDKGL